MSPDETFDVTIKSLVNGRAYKARRLGQGLRQYEPDAIYSLANSIAIPRHPGVPGWEVVEADDEQLRVIREELGYPEARDGRQAYQEANRVKAEQHAALEAPDLANRPEPDPRHVDYVQAHQGMIPGPEIYQAPPRYQADPELEPQLGQPEPPSAAAVEEEEQDWYTHEETQIADKEPKEGNAIPIPFSTLPERSFMVNPDGESITRFGDDVEHEVPTHSFDPGVWEEDEGQERVPKEGWAAEPGALPEGEKLVVPVEHAELTVDPSKAHPETDPAGM